MSKQFIQDFVSDLKDDAALTGVNVNALVAKVGTDGNGISVTQSSDIERTGFTEKLGVTDTEVDVSVYSQKYTTLLDMKDAIIARYHNSSAFTKTGLTSTYRRAIVTFAAETAADLSKTTYRAIITIAFTR